MLRMGDRMDMKRKKWAGILAGLLGAALIAGGCGGAGSARMPAKLAAA